MNYRNDFMALTCDTCVMINTEANVIRKQGPGISPPSGLYSVSRYRILMKRKLKIQR
jgi:hypothetical protein